MIASTIAITDMIARTTAQARSQPGRGRLPGIPRSKSQNPAAVASRAIAAQIGPPKSPMSSAAAASAGASAHPMRRDAARDTATAIDPSDATTRSTAPAILASERMGAPYDPDTVAGVNVDLELALRMADAADGLTMDRFRASDLVVETKPDLTPVSEADRAAEQALRAMLVAERADDAVLGEEFGTSDGRSRRTWIIDPIDGTKNYVRGVPVWATLIAMLEGDEVTVGVVSAPALGRRWWAARGEGAWGRTLGGDPTPLRVSAVHELSDASFSFSDAAGWVPRTPTGLQALLERTWRQRAYGDFWSHIMVAEGVVDIAAEPQLGPWDIAALVPIVQESGGRITAFDGGPALAGGCAVTTNGHLHEQVVDLLRGVSAG